MSAIINPNRKGEPGEKGEPGSPGASGSAATISVGTTTTGNAGTNAIVTNSGSSSAATLNFTIPRGQDGSAATVEVGTVTTGSAGSSASVTNSGTSNAAVLNFTIPRGDSGVSKRIVTMSMLSNASGIATFTYVPEFADTPHVEISMVQGNTREFTRLSASSRFGCTVHAFTQNATLLSLLGIDILTAGTTPIAGATIRICANEM